MTRALGLALIGLASMSCASIDATRDEVRFAKLAEDGAPGFDAVKRAFESRNPGYRMHWWAKASRVEANGGPRIVFVQSLVEGAKQRAAARGVTHEVAARVRRAPRSTSEATPGPSGPSARPHKLSVGDIVVLARGETLEVDGKAGLLGFDVPQATSGVPSVIRPDWDPKITDTLGGCATQAGSYRRILLTWLGKNGPYTYRSLNAHRVRITDSFSHYHPKVGGFDEFYLVQMTRTTARLLTSTAVAKIERPESVARGELDGLIREHRLAVGDLVYLPRGVMHRGLGGVLAQVITVPGFVPGSEIGVDHHLHAINKRFGLSKKERLPLHLAGAMRAIRR